MDINIDKKDLYNKYDSIINTIILRMYFNSKNTSDKIVLNFKDNYKGKKLYFEIAKMIVNLNANKIIVIDSNYLTYLKLKIKNKKLPLKRNKDNLKTFDHLSMTQDIYKHYGLEEQVLEDIYEVYYKKGAVIEE